MQWDTVGILWRVWMDVFHSSALQDPFNEEATEPTLWRTQLLRTKVNSSCHLPKGCLPHMQQLWKVVLQPPVLLHSVSVEELSTSNDRSSCGLLCQTHDVCFEYRAQVVSSDTLQMCQRDIPQREENTKSGWSYGGAILCFKYIDNGKEECKLWIAVISSHSHVAYTGMYIFNFTVLSPAKTVFMTESKLPSKIKF